MSRLNQAHSPPLSWRGRGAGLCALLSSISGLLLALTSVASAANPDFLELPAAKSAQASTQMMTHVSGHGADLVAVGDRGIAIWSADAGVTWEQGNTPVSVMLTSVFMVDSKVGWAAGHDGVILRTDDGGRIWVKQFDGNQSNAMVLGAAEKRLETIKHEVAAAQGDEAVTDDERVIDAENGLEDARAGSEFGPTRPFLSMWFFNHEEGFVVGSFGQIVRTVDGGRNWTYLGDRFDNPSGYHFNAIAATSAGSLLIAGEGGSVYSSSDRGETWIAHPTGYNGHLYGALEVPTNDGSDAWLVFGFGGNAFRSSDHGANWTRIDGLPGIPLVAGRNLGEHRALLLGRDGSLFVSDAGTTTFQRVGTSLSAAFADMTVIDSDGSIVLAGMTGVRRVAPITDSGSKP